MELKLRYPNITGGTEREQIEQIKRYLFQLVDELQFSDNGVQSTSGAIASSKRRVSSPSSSDTNAREVFAVLKPLIIKSADIVNAYYEKISTKFEGEYVAQSDFGKYTEHTDQMIEENSTAIEQAFTNVQTINDNLVGQIKAVAQKIDAVLTVNAYVKSGLLYYDDKGLPVYGVEVGQTNNVNGEDVFRKFARFTASRLSFYDQNDTEVAYISDYKLYITSVEILYKLVGGGFFLDFQRGFTLKYAGGE